MLKELQVVFVFFKLAMENRGLSVDQQQIYVQSGYFTQAHCSNNAMKE